MQAAKVTDLIVQFGDDEEDKRRGWLENGRLTINTKHPDFQARLRTTRQGNPRPSDRLNAYLAGLLAVYATTAEPQMAEKRFTEQIDLMVTLESQLRQLQKKPGKS